ncbi:MAG TPA: glycoside hydrolase family 32 protein [Ferruginibacter sp.]|jgi:fructan beta-fructosidase|nr:glycoside hydrolase family 32 protein [Ferruginibacter sp.]
MKLYLKLLSLLTLIAACNSDNKKTDDGQEPHRPQIHFSPQAHWMNDPNGLLFYNNVYHLFYQYYPDSTVWGPMHWGHATSTDMVHWQHQPIALYPDSLGYIFSGSAVADVNNTSGLGKDGKTPLVAIFTHHDPEGEKTGKVNYQNQSLAYSLDDGKTWTKYPGNPVLKNPGIKDFRDPKVSWYEAGKKWLMTLATQDRITFFSSPNLKDWTKESEFGQNIGAHGGVWECPDLFPMNYHNEKVWVLLVSINPGGPNAGSATQYFTGKFDGKTFTPYDTTVRWIDYGPDDYAGVTWSNTGDRRIFLGWMSNWLYGTSVPTEKWRSAMTVPRDLSLEKIDGKYFLMSRPVPELNSITENPVSKENITTNNLDLTTITGKLAGPAKLELKLNELSNFTITLANDSAQKLVIGYDKASNNYYIDRTGAGNVNFKEGFAAKHTAPRILKTPNTSITLILDVASVELFADDGLTVMTEIFFPGKPFTDISIQSPEKLNIVSLKYSKLKPVFGPNAEPR